MIVAFLAWRYSLPFLTVRFVKYLTWVGVFDSALEYFSKCRGRYFSDSSERCGLRLYASRELRGKVFRHDDLSALQYRIRTPWRPRAESEPARDDDEGAREAVRERCAQARERQRDSEIKLPMEHLARTLDKWRGEVAHSVPHDGVEAVARAGLLEQTRMFGTKLATRKLDAVAREIHALPGDTDDIVALCKPGQELARDRATSPDEKYCVARLAHAYSGGQWNHCTTALRSARFSWKACMEFGPMRKARRRLLIGATFFTSVFASAA